SMKRAIDETERRRAVQLAYNEANNIIPQTVKKDIRAVIEATAQVEEQKEDFAAVQSKLSAKEAEKRVRILEKEMRAAAKALEFEKAALLRDEIQKLRDIIGNDANDIDDVNP
ncbi:MAG: UvrB/UvrC motif-containing protein, partial [Peptococcaceae bacterium]|nr:UvrB/UvrC motif-containing protein [Peptococcaceae bacterium]